MKGSLLLAVLSLITSVLAIALLNRESTILGVLILISLFSVYTTKNMQTVISQFLNKCFS